MDRLSEQHLQQMPHERLEAYTVSLEEQLGRLTMFLSQVRDEWDRRTAEMQGEQQ